MLTLSDEVYTFFQLLLKLESGSMAGEIGMMFNIPQPFTVRSRRLSQVIQISHHHFKQIVQPFSDDGKAIITNFFQVRIFLHIKCALRITSYTTKQTGFGITSSHYTTIHR